MSNGIKSRINKELEEGHQPAESLAADPRWQLVLRICQSRTFSKSARLRELLRHISINLLQGNSAEVTEFEIGRRVFGRPESYVPSEDGVVRGAARQLRLKIKEYFETEGQSETWTVDIPKGGYVPVFSPRTAEPATDPAPAPAAPLSEQATKPSTPFLWLMIAAVALNVSFLGLNLWLWNRHATVPVTPSPEPTLAGALLKHSLRPVTVVVSDFSMPLLRVLFHPRDYTLNNYATWDYGQFTPPPGQSPRLASIARILRTHRITRLGDLNIVLAIQRATASGGSIVVRHARDISARGFMEGDAILLGNDYSTPWVGLFEDHLNFPHVRIDRGIGFANRKPRPGEQPEYLVPTASQEQGLGYGRLALVPNLSGKGSVLLISGINMVTMESAGDVAANPQSVPELLKALGASSLEDLPYFELILESGAVDNTPKRARILAARILGPRVR
ncbi:MAG: hypothetical protein LC126_09630 [Bryobacterales bacterium]|nr:hypothetical protein [Bryobacterales bacterium]